MIRQNGVVRSSCTPNHFFEIIHNGEKCSIGLNPDSILILRKNLGLRPQDLLDFAGITPNPRGVGWLSCPLSQR